MKLFRNKRGDTIVEVLLAITALSLVLSGAYVLANRSTLSYRQAQERGESQKVAQSQLELLKKYLSEPDVAHGVPEDGEVFCITTAGAIKKFAPDATPPNDAQAETFTAFSEALDTAECQIGDLYYNYIVRDGDIFTVHSRWASARGAGIEEATMVHRIYPDIVAQLSAQSIANPGCPANYYRTPLGACEPCPAGFTSPPGDSTACAPTPPKVIVTVKRVNPGAGNTTPACTSNSLGDKAGATVRLSGPSITNVATIGTPSTATFTNLAWGATYTATLFGVPGGTNPTSQGRPYVESRPSSPYVGTAYTTYNPSGGASFTACPSPASISVATAPQPTMGSPAGAAQEVTTSPPFKFIPNCYVRSVWRYENDPATYYRDTTRDPIYAWGAGARIGGATDKYYPGHWNWNGTNPAAYTSGNLSTPDWTEEPANGLGVAYYFHHNGNTSTGGHFYVTWQWNRYFTGSYGPPYEIGVAYYHGQYWVESRDATPTCP